ncbi:dihydrofolate reductase family protein [Corynebacterium freneyi]
MKWMGQLDAGDPIVASFVDPLDGVTLIAVTSIDGRAAVDGVSGGLGNPADAALLQAVRRASDVVLVGAGTVHAENYGPAAPTRLAVLSGSFSVDPDSAIFDDPDNPPILVGGGRAEPDRREALADAGAEILDVPDTAPHRVVDALRRRGLTRIALEGGPRVYRDFLRADAVDRAYVTLAPMVVGDGPATFGSLEEAEGDANSDGDANAADATGSALPLSFRAEAAAFDDSHLFVRYSRDVAG